MEEATGQAGSEDGEDEEKEEDEEGPEPSPCPTFREVLACLEAARTALIRYGAADSAIGQSKVIDQFLVGAPAKTQKSIRDFFCKGLRF